MYSHISNRIIGRITLNFKGLCKMRKKFLIRTEPLTNGLPKRIVINETCISEALMILHISEPKLRLFFSF